MLKTIVEATVDGLPKRGYDSLGVYAKDDNGDGHYVFQDNLNTIICEVNYDDGEIYVYESIIEAIDHVKGDEIDHEADYSAMRRILGEEI